MTQYGAFLLKTQMILIYDLNILQIKAETKRNLLLELENEFFIALI